MREEILTRLTALEHDEDVQIIFACESGSRAWGFASEDSDFDVRFLYVRHRDWYLSILPGRSVIEAPISGLLDIGGWDIRKALWLLRKSNPALLEWLDSPIVYAVKPHLIRPLQELIAVSYNPLASCHHYLSMASHQKTILVSGEGKVRRKKYLYILRALLAADWSQQRQTPPPMQFGQLVAESNLDSPVLRAIEALLEEKRLGGEMVSGGRIAVLDEFTDELRSRIEAGLPEPRQPASLEIYDRVLRETLALAWDDN